MEDVGQGGEHPSTNVAVLGPKLSGRKMTVAPVNLVYRAMSLGFGMRPKYLCQRVLHLHSPTILREKPRQMAPESICIEPRNMLDEQPCKLSIEEKWGVDANFQESLLAAINQSWSDSSYFTDCEAGEIATAWTEVKMKKKTVLKQPNHITLLRSQS
ncbi:hypothetical protein SUGI_0809290 [Cryptomeria japonica]|nr:hypothetical protein SUGI_0809290 [Cryptomeria japonica]